VISDHSKSAFYANGMKEVDILAQHKEIDKLNAKGFDKEFTILKSIESDILVDGSLDYDPAVLSSFDIVIASVHSMLKMDEDKATNRLIKAIENPYTNILGHLSGRLLLSRKSYPLDMVKIIDACAANHVAIELNANPHRLDIDAAWIAYCMARDVKISINPDAHHINGIKDIKYGIYAARRGGLQKKYCLNALDKKEFLLSLKK
jgi:DNA polymerase (family 10)